MLSGAVLLQGSCKVQQLRESTLILCLLRRFKDVLAAIKLSKSVTGSEELKPLSFLSLPLSPRLTSEDEVASLCSLRRKIFSSLSLQDLGNGKEAVVQFMTKFRAQEVVPLGVEW